jgi:hypothetical protein
VKTNTLNTESPSAQDVAAYHAQGTLASPHDTDIREAGWAKNKFRETLTPPQEIVSISDFSAQTDFNNITEQVDDLIRIGQNGIPLNNLRSAMGNLKRGKVYSFFGINGSGLTPFITSIAKGMCQSQESLVDQGVDHQRPKLNLTLQMK